MKQHLVNEQRMKDLYELLKTRDVSRAEIERDFTNACYEAFMVAVTSRYLVYEYTKGKKTYISLMK